MWKKENERSLKSVRSPSPALTRAISRPKKARERPMPAHPRACTKPLPSTSEPVDVAMQAAAHAHPVPIKARPA